MFCILGDLLKFLCKSLIWFSAGLILSFFTSKENLNSAAATWVSFQYVLVNPVLSLGQICASDILQPRLFSPRTSAPFLHKHVSLHCLLTSSKLLFWLLE